MCVLKILQGIITTPWLNRCLLASAGMCHAYSCIIISPAFSNIISLISAGSGRHPAAAYRGGCGGGAGRLTAPGRAGQGRIDVLVHPAMRGLLHWKVPPARPGRSILVQGIAAAARRAGGAASDHHDLAAWQYATFGKAIMTAELTLYLTWLLCHSSARGRRHCRHSAVGCRP